MAAAIYAALDFAAKDPSARALTIDELIDGFDGRHRYVLFIEHFAELLHAEAPEHMHPTPSTEQALIGGIVTVVSDHLRTDRFDTLVATARDLVELTLLPYLGSAEAKRWARALEPPTG